ncbi:alpha/beta hydrolase [Rathayibacter sp. YIM 133350]|uniref:esterase/lipase family protein n=1 Tax=Rathayibacter sp. YIM 133350 TaxID=3131992 RepID=UPI00307F48A5
MNPLAIGVSLVRDYAFVFARWWEAVSTRHDPNEYASSGSKRPVLMLPGIYEDWRFMRPVAARLAGAGHPVHLLPQLGYNRSRIAEAGRAAADLLASRGLSDVVIVAHSKGGLIGKWVMVESEERARITRMVAINTPFSGSRLARYAVRRELREFSPRDAALLRFSAITDVNARITSVYSSLDLVVPDGSFLAGAERNIRLPFAGHFRLLEDVRALAVVDEVVDDGERSRVS